MLLKRLLIAALVGLAAAALAVGVTDADRAERIQLQQAGTSIGTRFTIPVQPALSDPDLVLRVLQQAADTSQVNVLRTSWGYDTNDQPLTTHYAYIAADNSHLFDVLRLRDGRFPTAAETRTGTAFLASRPTGQPDQVGVVDDIGHNDTIYLRPLAAALASLPAPGEYGVECPQPEACTRFLDQVAGEFTRLGAHLEHNGLEQTTNTVRGEISPAATPWTWALIWAVVAAVAILAAFRQLYEAKRTAILTLHGHSALHAWFTVSGRLTLITMLLAGVCATTAAALVPGVTTSTVVTVAANVAGASSLAVIATLASTAYIKGLNLAQALKNRKDTRLLAWLSLALKFVIAAALIVMGTAAADRYATMNAAQAKLGSWQATSQYGVFVPKSVGLDLDELQTGGLASTSTEVHDLYPALDNRGALYVDATQYETQTLAEGPVDGYRSITVNPNYLAVYPITGQDGSAVAVDDHTTDWVLLVPSSLHDQAAAITTSFQASRTGGADAPESVMSLEKRLFGVDPPAAIRNQKVRIVWTADHQDIFSFDPDVAPDQGNRITDPIVAVMTTSNSVGIDRMNGISGSAGAAVKVKLVDADPATTLAQLQRSLRQLRLDDNLTHLVTLNDYALEELQLAQQGLAEAISTMLLTLLLFALLAVQSATLLFEQNARRIVVGRLHGLGFARRHSQFLIILALTWVGQTGAATVAMSVADGRWGLPQPNLSLILAAAVFAGAELLIAGVTLTLTEHRRVPAILKGEF